MLIRVGRLRICQERVLTADECIGIRDALEVSGLGPLEDGELPYSDHLRAQLAKLSGLELEHQQAWQAIRTGGPQPVPDAGCSFAALLALEPRDVALAFPTAGARAELEAGALTVWGLTGPRGDWLPEAESLICAPAGAWFLATWLRPPASSADDEITVRRPVVEPR